MNNNNLILAVILSVLILVGFQYFYAQPHQAQVKQQTLEQKLAAQTKIATPLSTESALQDRAAVLKDDPRLQIHTPELEGSLDLVGARLDDIVLRQYHETVAKDSPNIILLSPKGSAAPNNAYYTELGWLGNDATPTPNDKTLWTADSKELTPTHPVHLTWDNGKGLLFERTLSVDDQFMFTVTDHVRNTGKTSVTLFPFGLTARQGLPPTVGSSVIHEGPIGVLDGTLEEEKYAKLMKSDKSIINESTGGWLGMTDKYWLVAMVPPAGDKLTATFAYNQGAQNTKGEGYFQTDFRGAAVTLEAGDTAKRTTQLFVGAKRIHLLERYEQDLGIPKFSYAIDFGWFWFLTRPFLNLLDFLGHWLGSFGIAILLFTVALKIVTLPLTLKSAHSAARMKALQPLMKRIQEQFKDDKARQSMEMMELYKREKVNPMSGCMPMLIQIPIFFALYKVLYVGIELRQAPFYGWIKDMSIADPTNVFNLFGLIAWNPPMAFHIGVWPLLMGLTMFLQQRLSPQPPDNAQARMFMLMPIIFTYMLASMPAGLVIYWTWSNLLSIAQQWFIMRRDASRQAARK